jgi:hypothetical protein
VNAVEGDEIVGDQQEDQDTETGYRSGGGWEADSTPGETAKSGLSETDGGQQDQALVCIRTAASAPCREDHDGKADDTE